VEAVIPARLTPQRGQVGGSRWSGVRIRLVHGSRWLAPAFAAALAVVQPSPALAVPTEQEVKAALIFNITRFVEWPATAFRSPVAPLVVAIMGHDEVSELLEPMLLGKSVNGHPLVVRRVRAVDEARKCHVLYVASSEKKHADEILKVLGDSSVLTVADIEHFAERGGHINLVLEDQRVHVFVNPASAEDSHLKISAKLLSLAHIVGPKP
jgi:uncharacterized protein DUF4154